MRTGKVYLVGAGPGDPGLITVKGLELLRKAEVVVYDFLANKRLLEAIGEGAERIYVGKKGGEHTLPQGEITALLIRKAGEGKTVVRLKGGDPFVFGRGGEEAEELAEAGLPFEIVPGVTSAIAVPAYAGIPLTHRDYTSTVSFVTGHEDPTKEQSRIPWDRLSTGSGTLVFLMGVGQLRRISAELIRNGRPPETPAALIRWGTLPEQKVVTGALSEIAEKAEREGLRPPAVFLVGEVVALREKLNWFESLPLFGKKILVTRTREQAGDLSRRLGELGALPLEFPTIQVVPPESWADLDHCLSGMGRYDWVIFTSANGVKFFLERLWALGRDVRDLKGPRICAIGPGTAEALQGWRIRVDRLPREYRAEGVVEEMRREGLRGKRILIPRARVARDVLPEGLRREGAEVEVVEAYRTVSPEEEVEPFRELLRRRAIAAVTFTSSSTVANFGQRIGPEAKELLGGLVVACIGPVTAGQARALGIETTIMPRQYTIPALVEALADHFRKE